MATTLGVMCHYGENDGKIVAVPDKGYPTCCDYSHTHPYRFESTDDGRTWTERRGNTGRKIGDEYTSSGVNGHLYIRRVVDISTTGREQIRIEGHSSECGCYREPWEYDPEGLY